MKKRLRPTRTEPPWRDSKSPVKLFADEEAIETYSHRSNPTETVKSVKLFADEEAIETLMLTSMSRGWSPVKLFADEEAIETSPKRV